MLLQTAKRKAKRVSIAREKPEFLVQKGFGTEMPPQKHLVEIYFDQKNVSTQADAFFNFYEQGNWRGPKGKQYRNWKHLAVEWIFNYEQAQKLLKRQRQNALL